MKGPWRTLGHQCWLGEFLSPFHFSFLLWRDMWRRLRGFGVAGVQTRV